MSVIISPNMNLPVPVVGQEPGPQYAQDVNASLNIVDGHNHTPGYGVPIPAAAINYNADISAMDNRLTLAKSISFTEQGSPLAGVLPDIAALYVSGVDLYYNDGSGNQIRVTQGGSVTGTPGSITGLIAPASASYSVAGSEFIWQSDVNTAAGMDNGPITIHPEIANAPGITISAPNSLSADYSIILPGALPISNAFVTSDTSGNISFSPETQFIQQTMLAPRTTGTSVGTGGVAVSISSNSFSTASSVYVDVTDGIVTPIQCTIVTTGRPVMLLLTGVSGDGVSFVQVAHSSDAGISIAQGQLAFSSNAGSTIISSFNILEEIQNSGSSPQLHNAMGVPASSFSYVDFPVAGTQVYGVKVKQTGATGASISVIQCQLVAYEL